MHLTRLSFRTARRPRALAWGLWGSCLAAGGGARATLDAAGSGPPPPRRSREPAVRAGGRRRAAPAAGPQHAHVLWRDAACTCPAAVKSRRMASERRQGWAAVLRSAGEGGARRAMILIQKFYEHLRRRAAGVRRAAVGGAQHPGLLRRDAAERGVRAAGAAAAAGALRGRDHRALRALPGAPAALARRRAARGARRLARRCVAAAAHRGWVSRAPAGRAR